MEKLEQEREGRRRMALRRYHAAMLEMWYDGLNDCQIARRIGCSSGAVWKWRRRHRLERNCDPCRPEGT